MPIKTYAIWCFAYIARDQLVDIARVTNWWISYVTNWWISRGDHVPTGG